MLAVVLVILLFQSTLPRGSDMRELRAVVLATRFQSTLPRGSDVFAVTVANELIISIHAPLRERRWWQYSACLF